jgi:hypothetical protein
MFTSVQTWLKRTSRLLPVLLLPLAAQAQFYAPANVTTTAGTYTDLGTTGTAIATANTDDANSVATPIGFTFTYNGTAFTDFVLNTNGFVKLGTVAPTGAQYTDGAQSIINGPIDGADTNLVLPFNQDLGPGSAGGTEYRVLTTGTAPNRVCTIQWKNVADKPRTTFGTQYANFSFQAKLYETSNQIDFVYGPATAGALSADVAKLCVVGVKGSSATASVLAMKTSTALWSATTFLTGPYTGNAHNVRSTVLPDVGRTYRFSPVVPNDAAVSAVQTLTQVPIPQGATQVVKAVVRNNGTAALANLPVTLTVSGANAAITPQTVTVAALAPGTSTTVSFASVTFTAIGTNTLTVTVPPDGYTANDSRSVTQVVNTTTYSYADAGVSNDFFTGWGPPPSIEPRNVFAARFTTSTAVNVTQVRACVVSLTGAGYTTTVGQTVYGVLMDAAGNVLARSADHVVTAAEINTYVSFPLPAPYMSLPAGTDMYVGLAQLYQPGQTLTYAPLGGQNDGPMPGRTGAFYWCSTIYAVPVPPIDLYPTYPYRLMLEAVTVVPASPCPAATNLTATTITQTGATLTFTAPVGASGYTLTYSANGGPAIPVTPGPTGSPVVLTGLSLGTVYTVTLTTNCGGGQTSLPARFAFTTPQAAAPYAPLPVSESFEGPWLSVAAVRDAPTTNWRNTPASGVQSWRREDDGASANWVTNFGAYAPASSQGAHSARFDSYDAPLGTIGTLDLYVNMSPAGSKTLTFDYINGDGTDRLDVLVSTDGGATFSATPVLTAGVSTTFTARRATIASTSATTVIRFRATSDYGQTDIGIDNVRLAVVTATRNETLAATVGLYPNPAHGSFVLAVPAGPLHAATATLHNALGQVVQARQLRLPAAGGTAEFDVHGLAAGVYSLTLQTGETLVVKRVVVE